MATGEQLGLVAMLSEQRDRFGREIAKIVYHPAYLEMEKIGFEDFHDLLNGGKGRLPGLCRHARRWRGGWRSKRASICPRSRVLAHTAVSSAGTSRA